MAGTLAVASLTATTTEAGPALARSLDVSAKAARSLIAFAAEHAGRFRHAYVTSSTYHAPLFLIGLLSVIAVPCTIQLIRSMGPTFTASHLSGRDLNKPSLPVMYLLS